MKARLGVTAAVPNTRYSGCRKSRSMVSFQRMETRLTPNIFFQSTLRKIISTSSAVLQTVAAALRSSKSFDDGGMTASGVLFEAERAILIGIVRLAAVIMISKRRSKFEAELLTPTVCAQGATFGADDLAAVVQTVGVCAWEQSCRRRSCSPRKSACRVCALAKLKSACSFPA